MILILNDRFCTPIPRRNPDHGKEDRHRDYGNGKTKLEENYQFIKNMPYQQILLAHE